MLQPIDWQQPWLAPSRDAGPRVALHGTPVHQALNTAVSALGRFVPQEALAASESYEAHIHRTGTIPTRDNLHDFFNGLVWLTFPQAKRRLNDLQAAELARRGVVPRAGRCATR